MPLSREFVCSSGIHRFIAILLPALLLAHLACDTALPETRPDDFGVWMTEGGGMVHESRTLAIEGSRGEFVHDSEGNEVGFEFELTEGELDALYAVFVDNAFDLIGTRVEKVYDRGGIDITVRAAGERHHVSNSGMSFISSGSDEWRSCVSALEALIEEQAAPHRFTLTLELDESLAALERPRLYHNGDLLPTPLPVGDSQRIGILPGLHRIRLLVDQGDRRYRMAGQVLLTLDERATLRVAAEDGAASITALDRR